MPGHHSVSALFVCSFSSQNSLIFLTQDSLFFLFPELFPGLFILSPPGTVCSFSFQDCLFFLFPGLFVIPPVSSFSRFYILSDSDFLDFFGAVISPRFSLPLFSLFCAVESIALIFNLLHDDWRVFLTHHSSSNQLTSSRLHSTRPAPYTPPTHIFWTKTLSPTASKQKPVGEESPPGELPAADPSCSCRTSYIPAAVLIRTTPRLPTTLPPPHPDSPHPRAHQLPHTQCNIHPPLRRIAQPCPYIPLTTRRLQRTCKCLKVKEGEIFGSEVQTLVYLV